MTGDNTILTIFQNYFGQTIIGTLFILSVVYCLLTNKKQKKLFLVGILLVVLFVYNDLSRILIEFIGEKETYYRFIWMLPVTLIIAYAITDIVYKYKKWSNKIIFISGMVSIILLNSAYTALPVRESFELPEDIASEEVIEISEIISQSYGSTSDSPAEDMQKKRVAVPYELELELRTYDASISYGISRNAYMYLAENGYYTNNKKYAKEELISRAIEHGLPPEDPQELRTCIDDLGIKYLVSPTELYMENYFASIACYAIGYSDNYVVYRVY